MNRARKQSSTNHPIPIRLVSSTDHITAVTGATVAVTLSKDGANSFSGASGTVTEAGNGLYWLNGNASDRDTLGACLMRATATGADDFVTDVTIVAIDPFDANLSLTNLANPVLTAAQTATGVWQDATAGDFTATGSIGKSLYTGGAAPGACNGLWISNGSNSRIIDTASNVTGFSGSAAAMFPTNFNQTVISGTGVVNANTVLIADGIISGSTFSASGLSFTHGISISSDQGGPALFITGSSFSAMSITNTGGGAAVSVSNSSTGRAVSITGPFVASAMVQAIWDALTSALTTTGSVGKKIAGWVLGSDGKAMVSSDSGAIPAIPDSPTDTKLATMLTPSGGNSTFTVDAMKNAPGSGSTTVNVDAEITEVRAE